MAKQRTINEIRQTKEYYTGNDKLKSSPCANHDSERPKEFSEIYKEIANKVIDDIEDQLFELINEYS